MHLNILIFSLTGILAKMMAICIKNNGIFSWKTLIWGGLIVANCGLYALFWQQTLKRFPVHVAYAHSAVYNVWSLLWAFLIFSERISLGNVIGTVLIIAGILVIQHE